MKNSPKKNWIQMLIVALVVLLVLGACNMPLAPSSEESNVERAVKTLQAQATRDTLSTQIAQLTLQPTIADPNQIKPSATPSLAPTQAPAETQVVVVTKVVPAPATPIPVPVKPTAVPCNWVQFIADVSVPDGTTYAPGTPFTKTWRIKNIGSCTWTKYYDVAFDSGDQLGAPDIIDIPKAVKPGETVDISVDMVAPIAPGEYTGNWKMVNEDGVRFGTRNQKDPFWVKIKVSGSAPSASGQVFSFTSRACEASWSTGAGQLACPSKNANASTGYVKVLANPTREDGGIENEPGLLTVPNNSGSIYIIGIYPDFTVKAGDHFKATIMCEGGAKNCDVDMGLNYRIGNNGTMTNIQLWDQKMDGHMQSVNVDLSSLAGQTVQFILAARNGGSTVDMRALWLNPAIYRP